MTPDGLRSRTKAFSVATILFTRTLPRDDATVAIIKQLVRCSGSVGANYRSACLAKSPADMISKLKIVEEEADECQFWFEVLMETGTATDGKVKELHQEATELFRIMSASIKTLRNRQ